MGQSNAGSRVGRSRFRIDSFMKLMKGRRLHSGTAASLNSGWTTLIRLLQAALV